MHDLQIERIENRKQHYLVAFLDGLQAKLNVLRELQSASGEEFSVLMHVEGLVVSLLIESYFLHQNQPVTWRDHD
jgi:hypothetical protein